MKLHHFDKPKPDPTLPKKFCLRCDKPFRPTDTKKNWICPDCSRKDARESRIRRVKNSGRRNANIHGA